jgi:hypothetical protein
MSGDPFLPEDDTPPVPPAPWGFRIVLLLVAVYLLYRLGQGVAWVVQRLL